MVDRNLLMGRFTGGQGHRRDCNGQATGETAHLPHDLPLSYSMFPPSIARSIVCACGDIASATPSIPSGEGLKRFSSEKCEAVPPKNPAPFEEIGARPSNETPVGCDAVSA